MNQNNFLLTKTEIKGIDWVPRGFLIFLGSLFILLSVDVFDVGYTISETIIAWIMHVLPGFIIFGILYLTWRRDFINGIIWLLVGLFAYIFFNPDGNLFVSIPMFAISLIFFIAWYMDLRKLKSSEIDNI